MAAKVEEAGEGGPGAYVLTGCLHEETVTRGLIIG
jgi:hypothetical protein